MIFFSRVSVVLLFLVLSLNQAESQFYEEKISSAHRSFMVWFQLFLRTVFNGGQVEEEEEEKE